jgi:ABC-2 type transport system permease protein
LGIAVTAGSDESVIPFFEHGVSAEYEVARAIRVVARAARKRIGIVDTDAKLSGGIDFETGRTRVRWAIIEELRRQYDLVSITPYEPIHEPLDALVVVLPSTLVQREMDNVFNAIRRGIPALITVDPVPAVDMRLAPAAPLAAAVNPFRASEQAYARKNTGDVTSAMRSIGIDWPATQVVWDGYRPHLALSELPWEVIFVGRGNGNPSAFNGSHPASAGLQELVMMYAGFLAPVPHSDVTFDPLVQTGTVSGAEGYFQLVQPSPTGPVLNMSVSHQPEGRPFTVAAQVRSNRVNAIVVADLDFISDEFFDLRARPDADVRADNVAFFLNCIDVLAKDESFIPLRNRRVQQRTLRRVEAETRTFFERRAREEQQAAGQAKASLDHAQNAYTQSVAEIDRRTDLDAQARAILTRNVQEVENRRLDALRKKVELAKEAAIETSRGNMERGVRQIRTVIRTIAVVVPPLPMCVFGIVIFLHRRRRERQTLHAGRGE